MGLCLGTEVTEEEKKARTHSAKIDRDLYEYAKREMNVVKILLLGAAESGKSTLVKQMKIIHSNGFTKQELTSFKPAVLDNLLTSMKFVLHGMGVLRINLANSRNKVHAHSVLSCGRCFDEEQVLFPFLSHALSCLWTDQGVRAAAARGYEYELNDSALYFFENMARIASPDYVPTETDVLRVRLRTTGVIETQFKVSHLIFRMYDVGGQRTERRKWISCFEDVRAVLFVVSLSGYDMTLVEDPSMVQAALTASQMFPLSPQKSSAREHEALLLHLQQRLLPQHVHDFIHEQDRPFSRQDFTLWTTSAVIPATV
ncbi:guanine nucleotide-binding protein G(o) subunit alpha-like isoform X2 [Seriola lalandi dorsalis]|uniref:guanine nucleotide-binding protein G(o) subunit alpha-like isoform X2 n=1 Tax=Seriola lalandi dorsalis TaxID=1841481 RepID=UPI000C6FB9FF|nr:guanine nucleotide-binding protein G(o) subunit alpha-like isoform X2 [Seriola lalandi dorsalis]